MPSLPPVTSEHLALSSEYEEKWRAIATNAERIDQSRVRAALQEIYRFLKIDMPTLEFADSPYSAGLRRKDLIESQCYAPLNSLSREIQKKLKEELTLQLIRPFQKFTSDTAPGFEGDLTRIVAERNHAGLRQFLSAMNDQNRRLTSACPPFFSHP
jgi:hypothetical protein